MEFLCMDICNIDHEIENERIDEDSYDLVLDKACIDSIACNQEFSMQYKAVENVWRVLVSGGTFFMVSRGSPIMRMHLFES
jgi:hypothetical protein